MNDYKSDLKSYMLSYYVKYARLEPMINTAFANYRSNRVDIYIDIYDIFKYIYRREVSSTKRFTIVETIINMVAHYRRYFSTHHGVATRIYLVYADCSTISHKQFYQSFGDDDFKEVLGYTKMHTFLMDQLKLIEIIVAYIPDVYLVRRTCNFAIFAYNSIINSNNAPSIVLTKSKYASQIPAMCKNALLIRPKKTSNMIGDVRSSVDTSYMVTSANAIPNFFNKITSESTIKNILKLNSELLSLCMTITGLQPYKVARICNATQAMKMLSEAIDNHRILNGYNSDIDYVYDNIPTLARFIDKANFKFRFCAIDLIYQHRIYCNTPEALYTSWMVNFNDPESLKDINNNYFADNPLDLESL